MGIRELRKVASELGIRNYAKMKKLELEAAVAQAQSNSVAVPQEPSLTVGVVAGRQIVVSRSQSVESVGKLLGTFSKGDARAVRRLLHAQGFRRFAAAKRISSPMMIENAA
jgi:hypothetical protein